MKPEHFFLRLVQGSHEIFDDDITDQPCHLLKCTSHGLNGFTGVRQLAFGRGARDDNGDGSQLSDGCFRMDGHGKNPGFLVSGLLSHSLQTAGFSGAGNDNQKIICLDGVVGSPTK